ncbi:MAG: hypothetical protein MT334_03590 [Candidatus Nitrosopumilus limneticus]|nr:hypothetical protein [Candidatus Nitrosopumilus limneticus]MDC4211949.1 hypothetical protein [Candidatus Nitrosopumilus limneticus]MDC4213690.1 hypothetical protein [Candidatus Nitrosopumilus limneticus]MDC4214695.1 hypothetical protein [Candidatus Nitrosopumilus limneticus]MDC4216236.1 hypothetical protein [Candidatus Nitrosopumilus limneticus]
MGKANPYVHIPRESFPNWIWYAAECVGLIIIAFLSAVTITDTFEGLTTEQHNYVITGIFASFFLGWYVVIRSLILKKKILK